MMYERFTASFRIDFMPYSKKQIETAILMELFTKQEESFYWVPKTKTLVFFKLNPDLKFDEEDYHLVKFDGGEVLNAFHCDCVWGTYRDGHPEPNSKYCAHVLAVILRKIKNKEIPEYWKKAIFNENQGN